MTLSLLSEDRTKQILAGGGLLVDLRPPDEYLAAHVKGSISIMFENGPGFGGRARDLLPLDAKLVLFEEGGYDLEAAAAMLRGKGLDVVGAAHGLDCWDDERTDTWDMPIDEYDGAMQLLDVRDPGAKAPEGTPVIPVERLWIHASDLDRNAGIGVVAGFGVRAATAVGILERLGFGPVVFVRSLEKGSKPRTAGPPETIFRIGGPGGPAEPAAADTA